MKIYKKGIVLVLGLMMLTTPMTAEEPTDASEVDAVTSATKTTKTDVAKKRLTIGGYGEAVMTRNFYSDNIYRYTRPYEHKDDESHGRFDLPHVVINLGYDFGKGWTMGTEIEFEHGGTESAVEMDADEAGEYEAEVEKGGEVALEQFWINYKFENLPLNIRAGEIIVPVGAANAHHMPNEFFTVYRPEGEASILPNTWHQIGISLWGRTKQWKYEAQFLSGLDSERFGSECFVHYGANSPYEFKIANTYAAAVRIDNYSIKGLRVGLSGYVGNTFSNTLRSRSSKFADVKGTLTIGSLDFQYKNHNLVVRGNYDYAHLGDAQEITAFNKNFPTHAGQDGSPSKHQPVASDACAYAIEAGYNLFALSSAMTQKQQNLYLFGRYEYYNSMKDGNASSAYGWCEKKRMAVGINYMPIPEIIVKAEFSERFFSKTGREYTTSSGATYPLEYNDEPSVSIGITYSGWFK